MAKLDALFTSSNMCNRDRRGGRHFLGMLYLGVFGTACCRRAAVPSRNIARRLEWRRKGEFRQVVPGGAGAEYGGTHGRAGSVATARRPRSVGKGGCSEFI